MHRTRQVVQGNAEVFGSEMAPGRMYLFSSECKAAILSWEGCTIQMSRPASKSCLRVHRPTSLMPRLTSQESLRRNTCQMKPP